MHMIDLCLKVSKTTAYGKLRNSAFTLTITFSLESSSI